MRGFSIEFSELAWCWRFSQTNRMYLGISVICITFWEITVQANTHSQENEIIPKQGNVGRSRVDVAFELCSVITKKLFSASTKYS